MERYSPDHQGIVVVPLCIVNDNTSIILKSLRWTWHLSAIIQPGTILYLCMNSDKYFWSNVRHNSHSVKMNTYTCLLKSIYKLLNYKYGIEIDVNAPTAILMHNSWFVVTKENGKTFHKYESTLINSCNQLWSRKCYHLHMP